MKQRTAVVTGDITIDWMLAKPYDPVAPPPYWTSDVTAAAFRQAGGAALLAELVRRDAERVRMSLLAGAKTFEASSLPPKEQLTLHVSDDFLELI
jgi:hypothetical protein